MKRLGYGMTCAMFAMFATLTMTAQGQSLDQDVDAARVARAMQAAAQRLIEATNPGRRAALLHPLDLELRTDWHYTPRSRAGVALKDMSLLEREAVRALLAAPLSSAGLTKVQDVMALEHVLRASTTFGFMRIPENYAIALYGNPAAGGAWGWRIEGHHLSLHFSVLGDRVVSTAPHFIGANPAMVTKTVQGGPAAGTRPLGTEADLARALVMSLTDSQARSAIVSGETYGDMQSRNVRRATPLERAGIAATQLNASQQAALGRLVERFAQHLKPALAAQRMERVGQSTAATLTFAWAGSTTPEHGHYFRIQGERFLIEYDNSSGDHVHSVWRDFEGDFGRDALAEHYQKARGTVHRH